MAELASFQIAMDFIEDAKMAESHERLGHLFHTAARKLGFNHYACVSCLAFDELPEDAVFLAHYPDDWTEYYLENKYDRIDRILQVSLGSSMPFNWDHAQVVQGRSTAQQRFFDEAEDAGIVYGVTVPIHVVGGYPGAVNIVGEYHQNDPAVEHALHLMSVYMHDRAVKLGKTRAGKRMIRQDLTPRELECLKWVSAGKTDWEISCVLSIAERTVHAHIENAKRKLGVHTRLQAVVKAFLSSGNYLK
ncbi:LuxR family transcriptional regulator [Kordiimonas gwangyangensis]|uniref:LuxR family transcriptional regulator n=1 Tax=Kordiimonas gwangyangensis TaxID=288022 RepID=UPI00036428AC|nr:LuxR family transcriptional regulator [Kordiimonas gwangyangensis]